MSFDCTGPNEVCGPLRQAIQETAEREGLVMTRGSNKTVEFVLTAEVAGLSRSDIDIHAEESRIVIRGERSHGPVPCEQFHRVERGHGRFQRAFTLPEPIDIEGVSADLKDGLLTVTLPKANGRGARRIDVT